jgi:hypothetical protein
MYCEHCGAIIPDYSRFCEQCGKPVSFHPGQNFQKPVLASQTARVTSDVSSKIKKRSKSPDYSHIIYWIRGRYGSRFVPGMNTNEIRMQLEAIITNEQARGIPVKALKGFRAFIDHQHYGMLIQQRR